MLNNDYDKIMVILVTRLIVYLVCYFWYCSISKAFVVSLGVLFDLLVVVLNFFELGLGFLIFLRFTGNPMLSGVVCCAISLIVASVSCEVFDSIVFVTFLLPVW